MISLKELLEDNREFVGNFYLEPIGGGYELYGKQLGIKLGMFVKTSEGYMFKSMNPMFHYFQYKIEPFPDLESIKKALMLIKKPY